MSVTTEVDVCRATDGKPLKPTEEWSVEDDKVFERYYKSQHKPLNGKACTGCEW